MNELLLNGTTERWVKAYIDRPVATLLIDCKEDTNQGIEIAEYIYSQVVDSKNSPIIKLGINEKKSIGIEEVRTLHKTLSLSANKSGGVSRVAMIEQAELLTPEAQNTLLKLIEELPPRTLLFLVCANKDVMLPTVISRCFLLPVLPIQESIARQFAKLNGFSDEKVEKALLLSEGRATDFKEVLLNEDNAISKKTNLAKDFLQKTEFERQQIIKTLTDKEGDPDQFLRSLKLVAKAGLRNSKTLQQKKRWIKTLQSVIDAQQQAQANVSMKLVFLNLSMSV